jgi:hypothetical protein
MELLKNFLFTIFYPYLALDRSRKRTCWTLSRLRRKFRRKEKAEAEETLKDISARTTKFSAIKLFSALCRWQMEQNEKVGQVSQETKVEMIMFLCHDVQPCFLLNYFSFKCELWYMRSWLPCSVINQWVPLRMV